MWIHRDISEKISSASKQFPAIVLTGARQTGKTSLLKHLFPEHRFVTLDLPSNAELAERNPKLFLQQYPAPLIIDEVQYAPQLFRFLKIYIDEHRTDYGHIILTGSQQFELMEELSESLAGRCAIMELHTLRQQETRYDHTNLHALMIRGGYPELHARPELDRNMFYQSYLSTYLERDVRSLLRIGSLRDFERFIRACALRVGQILNKSELARDVGISPTTANEWLSVLQASHLVHLLEPWFSNGTQSLIKAPKLYFTDPGLSCFLVGLHDSGQFAHSPLLGALWENYVFSELHKLCSIETTPRKLWFWRDRYGLECDFLLHSAGRYTLLDAKHTENPSQRDFKAMEKIAQKIGPDLVTQQVILCRTQQPHPLGNKQYATPVHDAAGYLS